MKKILISGGWLLVLLLACNKKEEPDPVIPEPPDDLVSTLKQKADFPVGIQSYIGILDFPVPANRVAEQFDRYTATAFFWKNIEPTAGNFDYTEAERCLAFAESKGLRTHGHALIYFQNSITPDYLANFTGSKADFEAVVKAHIQAVVGHFKGRVASYDVANELLDNFKGTRHFNNYIDGFYLNDAGYEDFIGKCFRWAHEADPDAQLFYNDAKLELTNTRRLDDLLTLIQNLKAAGVPIHGVGTQMHVDVRYPIGNIENVLQKLAATGLQVHISELDVSVNEDANGAGNLGYTALTTDLSRQQREMYKKIAQAYRREVPTGQQWGITCWDLMDHVSWLLQFRQEWPCLFDSNCDKKPAFFGFLSGMTE
jgi:endo-1,4-beta-xylanase